MTGWMWIALGLVLAAIELATPGGFFIIFFGVGAVVVGLMRVAGLLEAAWAQWLVFPIVAAGGAALFRQPLLARLQGHDSGHVVDTLVGDAALPVDRTGAGRARQGGSARHVLERAQRGRPRRSSRANAAGSSP